MATHQSQSISKSGAIRRCLLPGGKVLAIHSTTRLRKTFHSCVIKLSLRNISSYRKYSFKMTEFQSNCQHTLWPSDVGILDMELYIPSYYVDQADLEMFDGVAAGKYTIGLGQKEMGFCSDREDIATLCLTVVSRLFDRHPPELRRNIGRLEVGTETLIDKSKSVKSVLMQLFEPYDQTDIEGVDTLNACFGGTQAVFNAVNWIESSSWDGRLALVVMGDIAVYGAGGARSTGGAGAMALLIGPNAPIVFDRGVRAIHMRHTYDFYKPNMTSEFPTVDGPLSIECYLNAIDRCYALYCAKLAKVEGLSEPVTLDMFDACLFHTPFAKLVQKSLARLHYLDVVRNPNLFASILSDEAVAKYRDLPPESTHNDKDVEKIFVKLSQEMFSSKTDPSLWLSKQIGNMYTPSLYSGLISLLLNTQPERLKDGARILLFSYGSGSAAAMFSVRIRRPDLGARKHDTAYSIEEMVKHLQSIHQRFAQRRRLTPEEFTKLLQWRQEAYGKAPYVPKGRIEDLFPGTYYLAEIDDKHRRKYEIAKFSWAERNGPVNA